MKSVKAARGEENEKMKFRHTNRPGFLLGFIDFFTAGLFFMFYMPLGLQAEIDAVLGHKTMPYWQAYLIGIPTLFIYPIIWMGRIADELRDKAMALGIEGPHTSFWHMFGWNTLGVPLLGFAVATHRFFKTLDKIEAELTRREEMERASGNALNADGCSPGRIGSTTVRARR